MKTAKTNRDEVRENTLSIPMTKEEKDSVRNASHKMGVSMSSFARIALKDFAKRELLRNERFRLVRDGCCINDYF